MSAPNKEPWPPTPQPAAGGPPRSAELAPGQRPLGGFGPATPAQQGAPGQPGAPVLPPPSGPYYPSNQPAGHNLPALPGLAQGSPPQHQQGAPQPPSHGAPAPHQAGSQGYTLPTLGQAMQHQPSHLQSNLEREREREMREREIREREARQRQIEEAAFREREQREREQRERQQRERQQREQPQHQPHQNHTGSIPIHQPVASKVPATIHGPGGLLSNLGAAAGSNPTSGPLGAPSGPGNIFGGPLQPGEATPRTMLAQPVQQPPPPPPQQHQMVQYGGAPAVHPMQSGGPALPQGQQPILNDALSYLDQVKVQFVDHPDVYNKFLDIMKDFKSQAIDTPGVIERVSNLFAGHPNLIQGFNTFLPPGYRIECGTGDDPNAIRVTTPMGTTVSSMGASIRPPSTGPGPAPVNGSAPRHTFYDTLHRPANANWQQAPQPGAPQDGIYSPSGRPVGPSIFGQQPPGHAPQLETQAQREQMHQQEQRAVSQLQSAASIATNGQVQGRPPMMQASPPLSHAVNTTSATPGGQPGLEKRGPVESNHAISYVNKIKNRFSQQPEIYKQFLEILQTYQRESKPIQDVYAQVTHLFKSAPDLLEDFKQFLPESAAHAKAQAAKQAMAEEAAMLSNVRNDAGYAAGAQAMQAAQTPVGNRSEMKMPPVGNFAPPSVGKENKKRRPGPSQTVGAGPTSQAAGLPEPAGGAQVRAGANQALSNKRLKQAHQKMPEPQVAPVSPTLTPALPVPMPPTTSSTATPEEIAFFDRVKKWIANKTTFNEFLKLCNLFSMDLIDKNTLVQKSQNFIGGNPELVTWFKRFVGYDGKDETIDNKPRPPSNKVKLSNCRGLGPSYRLLPKRERLRPCSGRDEMCHSVLNDDWASHPTWASEDSGFVAHRKNQFEEGLHRIEEERHDYDFNIEAALRTIQLLEPIVQQIAIMSEEERANFTLPPGIGGSSQAIYQRVIKKIYDREAGQKVIDTMHSNPCAAVPIVLLRVKQKVEEWKASQREWEKVWRDQTQKMFWRSLDHQGIQQRAADKKQFQPKTLQNEIHVKYEEQRRQRILPYNNVPKYQFEYSFADTEVIYDAARLLLVHIEYNPPGHLADRHRLEVFMKDFFVIFFGLDAESFDKHIRNIKDGSDADDDAEDASPTPEEPPSRTRRAINGKKTDLLRGVLERGRNGKQARNHKEGSVILGSRGSTPEVGSMDDDAGVSDAAMETSASAEDTVDTWLEHPASGNNLGKFAGRSIAPNEPYKRDNYNLYANLYIYCFFRMFEITYERLLNIKQYEERVHEGVRRAKMHKPAHDLKLIDKVPEELFGDNNLGPNTNYYRHIVRMVEEVVKNELESSHLEEVLRRYYLQTGWQLYQFDKVLANTVKFALQILVSESKDKSNDIMQLFLKDREKEETTHQNEIQYRKQVEKLIKEGDVYRISFNQPSMKATVQILKKEDPTIDKDDLTAESKWAYYIASYTTIEPTEGVPINEIRMPFLRRNLPVHPEDEDAPSFEPLVASEELVLRIAVSTYKMVFQPGTSDYWEHSAKVRCGGKDGLAEAERVQEKRKSKFEEKFVFNNGWMKGLSKSEVDRKNEEFRKWLKEGPAGASAQKVPNEDDEEMADAE